MNLQDALFNWLQMKIVSEARPSDQAAQDTRAFFEEILISDHHLSRFQVVQTDDTMYYVEYELDGKLKKRLFNREDTDQLLLDINSNPKYN